MSVKLLEFVRVLDMIDDESLENELSSLAIDSNVSLDGRVIDEINRLNEDDSRRDLVMDIVTAYANKDIRTVIDYYQKRVQIANLPGELVTKIVLNLPGNIMKMFYQTPDYKKIIDRYALSIPETTEISKDEGLLNSLICLPMFYKKNNGYEISNFTIAITGKKINGDYIFPVNIKITITSTWATLTEIWSMTGTGTISNNRATGNWGLRGTVATDRAYHFTIKRIVSLKEPNLLFTMKNDEDSSMIIFNPIDKYYVSGGLRHFTVYFYKYSDHFYGNPFDLKNINGKYHIEVIRSETLEKYPTESKILEETIFVNLPSDDSLMGNRYRMQISQFSAPHQYRATDRQRSYTPRNAIDHRYNEDEEDLDYGDDEDGDHVNDDEY